MQITSTQQILVPKKVYIGDTAELRCTFNSPSPGLKSLVSQGTAKLTNNSFSEDYDIKSVSLSPSGVDFYQLTITFTPWKTGMLQFPPLEIEGADIILEFQPVQIVSLITTEGINVTTLRDTAAPLLLPGTAYKLYGTLTAFIILLIIIIRIIVKRKNLLFYLNTKRLLRKYKKNKKQTLRFLRQLVQKNTNNSDQLIAEKIQKVLRNYLEVRFDYPFTKTVTSEMMKGWQSATSGLLAEKKEEAFGEIAASFIRTDFIRYSKGGSFRPGETARLVDNLISSIEVLENDS